MQVDEKNSSLLKERRTFCKYNKRKIMVLQCESTPPSSFHRITVPLPSYEEICAREKQQCDQKTQPISDHLGMRPTSVRVMHV